jgi:hypothetical protein
VLQYACAVEQGWPLRIFLQRKAESLASNARENGMANWLEKLRMKRRARVETGEPLTDDEHDHYRSSWGKVGRVVGDVLARATGRSEAREIAEKTGEQYGKRVAKDLEWRIAERQKTDPAKR